MSQKKCVPFAYLIIMWGWRPPPPKPAPDSPQALGLSLRASYLSGGEGKSRFFFWLFVLFCFFFFLLHTVNGFNEWSCVFLLSLSVSLAGSLGCFSCWCRCPPTPPWSSPSTDSGRGRERRRRRIIFRAWHLQKEDIILGDSMTPFLSLYFGINLTSRTTG